VVNATIENAEGIAVTDDEGFFQAEITRTPGAGLTLEFSDDRGSCMATASDYPERSGVAFLDSLVCERAPEKDLPNFVSN
jgi:hypothetical protein